MKKIQFEMPTQADFVAQKRRTHSTPGTVNGGTKVQSAKGKKSYNRAKSNDKRNW